MNRFGIVIPIYNHHHKLHNLLTALAVYQLPIFLVDDGSEPNSARQIVQISNQFELVKLYVSTHNRGKGGAVMKGFELAAEAGITHAIQIDADFQHQVEDLPQFMALANANPQALICGIPKYDETVNKGRLYARYLTHIWVWINTLSLDIKDSMCGFRCYPLAACMDLIGRVKMASYMSFDTEIVVRLHWQGVEIINLPTTVVYHQDVPSNFRLFKDNVAISWGHTKLFFGMLYRLPRLLLRKFKR